MKAMSQFMHFHILLCKKTIPKAKWPKSLDLQVTGQRDIQDSKSGHQQWSFTNIPCSSLEIHFFAQFQKDLQSNLHKEWTTKVEVLTRMPNEDNTQSSYIKAGHQQQHIDYKPGHKGWNSHFD